MDNGYRLQQGTYSRESGVRFTLLNNVSVAAQILTFDATAVAAVQINYTIVRGTAVRTGVYTIISGTTASGGIITAGSFVVGSTYTILTVGTTDFTLIGATSNTIGITFVATGIGAGTGTATNLSGTDTGVQNSSPGVTFSVTESTSIVSWKYVTTATGSDAILRYSITYLA